MEELHLQFQEHIVENDINASSIPSSSTELMVWVQNGLLWHVSLSFTCCGNTLLCVKANHMWKTPLYDSMPVNVNLCWSIRKAVHTPTTCLVKNLEGCKYMTYLWRPRIITDMYLCVRVFLPLHFVACIFLVTATERHKMKPANWNAKQSSLNTSGCVHLL